MSANEVIHTPMLPLLDASNPEAITYSTDELKFTILGGIRLDRLRVTLRTEILSRKFPHYMNNPELAALPMHQSWTCTTTTR